MKPFIKIFLIIFLVATISILAIGGTCYYFGRSIQTNIEKQVNEKDPVILEKSAQSIVSFKLPKGYTILKTMDIPIIRAQFVTFKYKDNKQFLALINPVWLLKLNEQNLKKELTSWKFKNTTFSFESGDINIEIKNIEVIENGTLQTSAKEIPYVHVTFTLTDLTNSTDTEYEGIVAVITSSDQKKNVLLISSKELGQLDISIIKNLAKGIKSI